MTAHIHIFSGRFGFIPSISAGMARLEALTDSISDAKLHDWKAWRAVAQNLINHYKPGDDIVLIGHSEGAKSAVDIATELALHKIPVKLIVGIDPTLNTAMPWMPDTVERVAEYHATLGIVATVRRIFGNGQFKFRGWPGKRTKTVVPGTHVGVSADSAVHKEIVSLVRAVI